MSGVVRFLDLSVDDEERKQIGIAIDDVLKGGQILNGPEVALFEEEVAGYCGTRRAVGVGSGTSALYVIMKAFKFGPGDEVILSALSFPGSANAIAAVGATPVFVDVSTDMLIDPARIEEAITPKTVAVMPIHFTGRVCDMPAIRKICGKHDLICIEDAAPAFGASLDGKRAGSLGHAAAFSMNTMKILASVGEAGAVTTDLDWLADRCLDLRYHGIVNKRDCVAQSTNNRLDTIQAAVLLLRLRTLPARQKRRQEIAEFYNKNLRIVTCPNVPENVQHAWCHYTILSDSRDALQEHLDRCSIETRIYHPQLMPEHPAYKAPLDAFPVGRDLVKQILCLPMHHKLTDSDIERVVENVNEFHGAEAKAA